MFYRVRTVSTLTAMSLVTGGLLVTAPADAAPAPHATAAAAQSKHVVSVAKRYVGKTRYRSGGASPKRGFDCSGYTRYVFRKAHVAKLPHNAEAQRRMKRTHRVSARKAKPGDLVFFGKPAYHVGIYAGKHRVYNASTPGTKVKKQKIWTKHVTYERYVSSR